MVYGSRSSFTHITSAKRAIIRTKTLWQLIQPATCTESQPTVDPRAWALSFNCPRNQTVSGNTQWFTTLVAILMELIRLLVRWWMQVEKYTAQLGRVERLISELCTSLRR